MTTVFGVVTTVRGVVATVFGGLIHNCFDMFICRICSYEFDTRAKVRYHIKRICNPMERLMKNILRFKPDTIEKLRDLLMDEDVGLEPLKERLTKKLSDFKAEVKLYIH